MEGLDMRVINEKDYVYLKTEDQFHIFQTNPKKVDFDLELIYVIRARYIKENGGQQFFDYVKEA